MSKVYYVAPGNETDAEPRFGWYYVGAAGRPRGPFFSREDALAAFGAWNARRQA